MAGTVIAPQGSFTHSDGLKNTSGTLGKAHPSSASSLCQHLDVAKVIIGPGTYSMIFEIEANTSDDASVLFGKWRENLPSA